MAKECGCKFIFGNDAHNYKRYYLHKGVADIFDLKDSDIIDIAK